MVQRMLRHPFAPSMMKRFIGAIALWVLLTGTVTACITARGFGEYSASAHHLPRSQLIASRLPKISRSPVIFLGCCLLLSCYAQTTLARKEHYS